MASRSGMSSTSTLGHSYTGLVRTMSREREYFKGRARPKEKVIDFEVRELIKPDPPHLQVEKVSNDRIAVQWIDSFNSATVHRCANLPHPPPPHPQRYANQSPLFYTRYTLEVAEFLVQWNPQKEVFFEGFCPFRQIYLGSIKQGRSFTFEGVSPGAVCFCLTRVSAIRTASVRRCPHSFTLMHACLTLSTVCRFSPPPLSFLSFSRCRLQVSGSLP